MEVKAGRMGSFFELDFITEELTSRHMICLQSSRLTTRITCCSLVLVEGSVIENVSMQQVTNLAHLTVAANLKDMEGSIQVAE